MLLVQNQIQSQRKAEEASSELKQQARASTDNSFIRKAASARSKTILSANESAYWCLPLHEQDTMIATI